MVPGRNVLIVWASGKSGRLARFRGRVGFARQWAWRVGVQREGTVLRGTHSIRGNRHTVLMSLP